ncbi:ABC transporter permease [Rubinisphaera margarita]|uniref:ABC transporter permease n=1 Tax=Rubinisphaera margarita TaxID=2909586 RepID=UPI001EE8342F|nr:ABC-2 family transporter protein [Rubinisphaera margarita]MCG6155716.1 ABC-2 family transporter protein [Rubinisphaera margarita]
MSDSSTTQEVAVRRSWFRDGCDYCTSSAHTSWVIFKTCVEERLVYRGDFFFSTFIRFLPIITQIFLWHKVYAIGTSDQIGSLNGYSYEDMVAYYLLAMVARAFSSMPGLASGIGNDIRDGSIKKYVIQPIDLLGYLFWHRIAHKLVYYLIATIPFAIVFYVCRSFFPHPPSLEVWIAFGLSLGLGFLVGFLLEALIGLIGFWFLEVSSLLFIYMMFNYFLSGHMIPLDWLPGALFAWIEYLPFKYLAYFPAAIFLGKIPPENLWMEIGVECVWVVVLLIANRVVLRRGLRRYGAFGG